MFANELDGYDLFGVPPSVYLVAPTTIGIISDALLEFGSAILLFPAMRSILELYQLLSGLLAVVPETLESLEYASPTVSVSSLLSTVITLQGFRVYSHLLQVLAI